MLDQKIIWKLDDPRYLDRGTKRKDHKVQRQWTIEARADFEDPDKNAIITQAVREAAAHINAQLVLLSEGQKPLVVAYSDDFFAGHEDIAVLALENPVGKAVDQLGGNFAAGEVSSELLEAAQDIARDTKARTDGGR